MLQAVAARASQRAVSLSPLQFAAQFVRNRGFLTQRRAFTFQAALATLVVLVLVAIAGLSFLSWPKRVVAQKTALAQIDGVVEIMPAGSDTWQPALAGWRVKAGDRVRTSLLSAATLIFFDGSTTDLQAETEITVVQTSSHRDGTGKVIVLRQTLGQTYNHAQSLSDRQSRFEIETPTALTAVRGTEFILTVEATGATHVSVIEGVVDVMAQGAIVAVQAGQEVTVRSEQPPVLVYPTSTAPPTPRPTPLRLLQETPSREYTPTSTETAEPTDQRSRPQPSGQTDTPRPSKTPQPPGQTSMPQSPDQTKTPQPPGLTMTPQPPGLTKTPEPPGQTKTPEPPGQTQAPKPTKAPKPPTAPKPTRGP